MQRTLLALVLLALVAACGSQPAPAAAPATASAAAPTTTARTEGTARSADGVAIAYDTRGRGDTALVFVHGWSCDRSFWKEQADAFATEYRVVTLDLGGHGASGANRSTWTIESLGADVQAVIEKVGVGRAIVVGHSMGAPVALDVARRLPGTVAGVVCVDALQDVSRRPPPELKAQIMTSFEKDFAGTVKMAMSFMLRPETDKALADWITAKMTAAPPAVAVPLMRALLDLDEAKLLAAAKVPVRCINAAPWGPQAAATNVTGNKQHADFDAVTLDGVDHFLQLEQPAAFNAKLRDVLATLR